MKRFPGLALVAAVAVLTLAALRQTTDEKRAPARDPLAPLADHHAHLLSPAAAKLVNDPVREPKTAEQLIPQLDAAGIQTAAVLSTAYWFGSPLMRKAEGDEYVNVRAENDWTVQEAARFPTRLFALCSFNPLKDYAREEIDRCAKLPQVRGLKLHFGNSGVEVRPGYTDEALAAYAEAIAAGDPRTKNLYFDVATVADGQSDEALRTFALRIRQVGLKRVLFGTDLGPPPARQSWATFRTTVPLTEDEIRTIAGNVAPYLR